MTYLNLRAAVRAGDGGAKSATAMIHKYEPKHLLLPLPDEIISPLETVCYYGSDKLLKIMLKKLLKVDVPRVLINKCMSHALWRGHSDVLVTLLDRFSYTFDQGEFHRLNVMMAEHTALKAKIQDLQDADFSKIKSIALLEEQTSPNMTVYLGQYLSWHFDDSLKKLPSTLTSFRRQRNNREHVKRVLDITESTGASRSFKGQ